MRSGFWTVLGLTLLAGCLTAGLAHAEDPAQPCDVPAYLLTTDSSLPKVAEAVKNGQPLNVLVVGSRSSTIATSEASAYPGTVAGRAEGEAARGDRQPVRGTTDRQNRRGSERRAR